jgi:predicted phosphodiesterase
LEQPLKIVFISDIHSNHDSLVKFLEKVQTLDYAQIYCLGDIDDGSGKYLDESVELIQKHEISCLKGNRDQWVISDYENGLLLDRVSESSYVFLRDLPTEIFLDGLDCIISHSIPGTKDLYLYANSDFSVLDEIPQRYIVMGHTHYPMLMSYYKKKILNPGSLGQPRDGYDCGSFLVWDTSAQEFMFHRIKF